jgi:hypothetical protein
MLSKLSPSKLFVSKENGGPGFSRSKISSYLEGVASFSYVTAFMKVQYEAAVSLIYSSENKALQAHLLRRLEANDQFGIGIGHLKNTLKPTLVSSVFGENHELTGVIPWISGWSLFDGFIIGFISETSELYAFVEKKDLISADSVSISNTLDLVCSHSSDTRAIKFLNFTVSRELVICACNKGGYAKKIESSYIYLSLTLGVIKRQLKHLFDTPLQNSEKVQLLSRRFDELRSQIYQLTNQDSTSLIKLEVMQLGYDILYASSLAEGGKALLQGSFVEAAYRELLQSAVINFDMPAKEIYFENKV